ncbi:MAG: phytanoyl-CoA dioxygenase family protein [Abditibacteriales bacterium]|nr:phytanoyl-CoA dioxygenase family protein [Abditibacteriales bacterium]MDW8366404.1 phytanoyl-CoA dioxygenase family protein [Abditibacteriales bacterium]
MLTQAQIDFFSENGFLRLEQVYPPEELQEMSEDLNYIMHTFANWDAAWKGPWRKEYLKEEEDKKATLVAIHELQHYSAAWTRAITNPTLADAVATLLDTDCVEVHHCTLHAKAPDAGAPFPMHQDLPFYPHEDGRYIDALIHLDNADEESGCIKFLAGSYKLGKLQHITGPDTAPHLPTDKFRLQDAVSVPAQAGDVVLFHLWTVHGSSVNNSGRWRRLVRVGFRDPRNRQEGGQAMGRPGLIVKGRRPKIEGQEVNVYGNWTPPVAAAKV